MKECQSIVADKNSSAIQNFEDVAMDKDESWYDNDGMGLLMHSVVADEINVVREILEILKQEFKGEEYDILSHEFVMKDMLHLEFRRYNNLDGCNDDGES